MRRYVYWFGWGILFLLPVIYAIQIFMAQDLPHVETWKWFVPFAAIVVIFLSRNRDDVLKHHIG